MRTDIVLDHATSGRRIVIDTKFTSIVTRGWYRRKRCAADTSIRSTLTFVRRPGAGTCFRIVLADYFCIRPLDKQSTRQWSFRT